MKMCDTTGDQNTVENQMKQNTYIQNVTILILLSHRAYFILIQFAPTYALVYMNIILHRQLHL